jgi:pimeloyl-ACP methyl ester carboxylesterase
MKRAIFVVVFAAGLLAVGAYRTIFPTIHPDAYGVQVETIAISHGAGVLPVTIVYPSKEASNRPLLVLLHGRGSSPHRTLSDEMFAALRAEGEEAPIIAIPESPIEGSYWHDREDGNFGRVVLESIDVALDESGADSERVAVGGISMGGFGALNVGGLDPDAYCAIGAHSPALWREFSETAAGAFDDAQDFEAHDVMEVAHENPALYGDTPVWIDVGADDPFASTVKEFADSLDGDVSFTMPPGGHDDAYWRSHMDGYIAFYSDACAR